MKKLYIDCLSSYYRAALVQDGELTELIYQDRHEDICVGDIYEGRVEKVLPSGIAFVNIGKDKPVFIQDANVKSGKELAVQIEKEAFDEKCAVATEKLSLNGKYVVVIFNDGGTGVSKKINDPEVRKLLKETAEKYSEKNIGIIIRTNAEKAAISDIEEEILRLKAELLDLIKRSEFTKAPAVLRKETDMITRTVRDIITADCDGVVLNLDVDTPFEKTVYQGKIPMFNYYGIESQIEKLFHKKIWLKSGGYIVIDETEAMTVIDVNSGKAVGEKNYIRVNSEAAKEAARQIRLRNLSGMIIIDFINVRGGNEAIYASLEKYLSEDRVKTFIVGMTELGLMQLTRQKKRKPLSKYITCDCPVCNGLGYVKSLAYLTEIIINQIADIFSSTIYDCVEVSSSNAIVSSVKQNVDTLCNMYNKKVTFKTISTTRFDYYELNKIKL